MKFEFEVLCKVLIPILNKCGNCGRTKCFNCKRFDESCVICRSDRCEACVKFLNSIDYFYEHTTLEQWNYICNFIHDLCQVHWITRMNFEDIKNPVNSSIKKTSFIVSSTDENFSLRLKKDGRLYSIFGNRKYKFYFKF